MRIRTLTACGLMLSGLASCGGSDKPETATYVLDWGSFQVQSGEEGTRCVTLDLGNDGPVKVNEVRNVLGTAALELIVYKADNGTVNTTPGNCEPFIDTADPAAGRPLVITVLPEQTLTLPEGVAFSLAAHQKIRLQLRFLNDTAGPVNVTALSEFTTMDADDFEHEAGLLVAANLNINIPSGGTEFQLGPKHLTYPAGFAGARVFAMTGLTHRLGTGFEGGIAATQDGVVTTLYQPLPYDWSAPPTTLIAPAVQLPAGGGLRFTCTYRNETGATVTFGSSSTNEVCFLAVYYYPRQDAVLIF